MGTDITAADLAALNDDVKNVKQSISERERAEAVAKAREDTRKELEKEQALQKQLEEQSKRAKELEDKLTAQQKESEEKLQAFQRKLDEMATSKQVVAPNSVTPPFGKGTLGEQIDTWNDDKVNEFEEESARAFLGPDYDRFD